MFPEGLSVTITCLFHAFLAHTAMVDKSGVKQ